MATKTVVINDFSKAIEDFTEERLAEYKAATVRGAIDSLPDLIKSSPVDTGLYAQSWNLTETERSVILGNTAPHAPIIERGARPFTPPIKPLLEWAKRVLQDPSQPPNYSSRVWALAKGTQNKIRDRGMEPKNILEKAIPGIINNIRKEFEKIG